MCSDRTGHDQAGWGLGGYDLVEGEAGSVEQHFVLEPGAFPAGEDRHHDHVDHFPEMRCTIIGDDVFEDQQGPVARDRESDRLEDANRIVVVPVVQDERQQVGIAARWDRFEEVAGDCLDPVRNTHRVEERSRGLDHASQVEQHTVGRVAGCQRAGQERSVGTTDVDDPVIAREVMGRDRSGLSLGTEAADDVSKVLDRCPNTILLVTSRQRLDIAAEDVVELRGLPFPELGDLSTTEAVRLFVDRAYRIDKSFSLNDDNASDIARLCRLVEGMPLHLELAASRIRHMSVAGIVEALESDAGLPGVAQRDIPERHATFDAVFDQSWRLLGAAEQRAFARLTVTRGGFDRHAATALSGDPAAASSIARRSLLFEEGGGRYRFHELIRQATGARLTDDERRDAEVVHARHYLAALAAAAPGLLTKDAVRLASPLTADLDNIRAAWSRAIDYGLVRERRRLDQPVRAHRVGA